MTAYAFMTTKRSRVYHVIETMEGWPWLVSQPAKSRCGLGFWVGEWTNSRPKGKALCSHCVKVKSEHKDNQ